MNQSFPFQEDIVYFQKRNAAFVLGWTYALLQYLQGAR